MATALGQIVPFYYIEFATTALRLANTFTADQVGRCSIRDGETNKVYTCIAAGSGVTTMSPIGSYQSSIPISLMSFRECDGSSVVGNIAANGGILASDTTPILRGRTTVNNQEISWATGNVDAICTEIAIPADFDGSQDVTLELIVNSGTTNAVDMVVATTWDGGTEVADAAVDTSTKSATDHALSVTIAAADVPDAPKHLSLRLTPPTHGTNAIQLSGVRILYVAK